MMGLPKDCRGIPVHLSIDYHKKARGLVTALCQWKPVLIETPQDIQVGCLIQDESGETVAMIQARWRIGPKAN
jgi:hypothetical protein